MYYLCASSPIGYLWSLPIISMINTFLRIESQMMRLYWWCGNYYYRKPQSMTNKYPKCFKNISHRLGPYPADFGWFVHSNHQFVDGKMCSCLSAYPKISAMIAQIVKWICYLWLRWKKLAHHAIWWPHWGVLLSASPSYPFLWSARSGQTLLVCRLLPRLYHNHQVSLFIGVDLRASGV